MGMLLPVCTDFPITPLEQKVELSNLQDRCSSLLKLAWDYFWPHFEKQDVCHGVSLMAIKECRDFPITLQSKVIVGRVLRFAGYVHHYRSLLGNIFCLILKNKIATMSFFDGHQGILKSQPDLK